MQGKYRPLGTASVSIVGQGTWNMERDDPNQVALALQHGLDLNMNHIDTAEIYGSGRVERLVGKAIRGRRDDVFLASKVMPGNASYRGTLKACEASLKRLGTHYLDLYLLHWPGNHPLEETIRAFEELVESGKIRSYGVSNFDVLGLERILDLAGPNKIACNQVLYHLGERTIERQVLPWCEEQGVAVVGYSPFGSGRFPLTGEQAHVIGEVASARDATVRRGYTGLFDSIRESIRDSEELGPGSCGREPAGRRDRALRDRARAVGQGVSRGVPPVRGADLMSSG